jgi:hypothetical protein
MSRYLRYLRIAWTAICGIVFVLLIVLWVRSYSQLYCLSNWSRQLSVSSCCGHIFLNEPFYSDESAEGGSTKIIKLFGHHLYFDLYPAAYIVQDGVGIAVPVWGFVGSALTIGVIPWIRWPKRFTLRALLIATTVVAVILGIVRYFSTRPPTAPRFDQGFGR